MLREAGYPVAVACAVLDLSHSSYYYHPVEKDEDELEEAIEQIAGEFSKYGTRRVSQQLRRSPHNLPVGRKRVRCIMAHKDLLRPLKKCKKRTTNSEHPYPRYPNLVKELEITYPDQVWASDITYIRLQNGFVYLAVVLDIFTRAIRGWCLSLTLDQE